MNLILDHWLPIRRQLGSATIRPAQIVEALYDDPVIAPNWPRPDFRFATLEFLIGLLATACPPANADAWLEWWEAPPDAATLDAAFAPLAHAFELDGAGPRFLQDLEDLAAAPEPVERMLIEAPGGSTTTKNTDLLVKRGRVASLGRATAAIALYTFQSWAPAGGAGNRTGLRGGGPLITLVAPEDTARRTLWHLLWANVPHGRTPATDDLPKVFPWLAATTSSVGGRGVTPADAHPLQAWWGMPRRIRLDFATTEAPMPCGLTGAPDEVRVTGWRQRPNGVNYLVWGGRHPLTPHYRLKPATELLPVHPQPGGIGYRHWLGLVVASGDGLRVPAAAVAAWRDGRQLDAGRARLLAAGYDMDNMKARGFVEHEMPLVAGDRDAIDPFAAQLVGAATQVASLLRGAVRDALFSAGATVKADADALSAVREWLWATTEQPFFVALEAIAQAPDRALPLKQDWVVRLRGTALALFDEAAPLSPEAGESVARRLATARRRLLFALLGYGAAGVALFKTLGLAAPVATGRSVP